MLAGLVYSNIVLADDKLLALSRIPFPWNAPSYDVQDVYDTLSGFADFVFTIAGVLVGITIVWAGIIYATAGSDTAKVGKAKTIFKNGLIASLIIFAVGLILSTLANFAGDPAGFFF